MKHGKKEHCHAAYWTELNNAVTKSSELIRPTSLVVLGIVGKNHKGLAVGSHESNEKKKENMNNPHLDSCSETDVIHGDI